MSSQLKSAVRWFVAVLLLLAVMYLVSEHLKYTQHITIVLEDEVPIMELRDDQIITAKGIELTFPEGSETLFFVIYREQPESPLMTGLIIQPSTGAEWSALSFVGLPSIISINVDEKLAVVGSTESMEEGIVIDFRSQRSWFDPEAFKLIESEGFETLPTT